MTIHNIFYEWMRFAEGDLEVAKHITTMVKPNIEISCYHCQQCTEKALKAFLIFHSVKPKFIHDLAVLCNDCQEIDPSFSQLEDSCYVLNQYITNTRYPSSTELSEADMKAAIVFAEGILQFVKSKTA